MVSNKLIILLKANIDKLNREWIKKVKASEHMKTYHNMSHKELQSRNVRFFNSLVIWLDAGGSNEEIKTYFSKIGRERYHEGIPLEEINFAIITAKRVLWDLILSEGLLDNALAIYQALEMLTMIYNFFDMGYFYIGKEYSEEVYDTIKKLNKFTDNELKKYLAPGTLITDKELEAIFGINFTIKK